MTIINGLGQGAGPTAPSNQPPSNTENQDDATDNTQQTSGPPSNTSGTQETGQSSNQNNTGQNQTEQPSQQQAANSSTPEFRAEASSESPSQASASSVVSAKAAPDRADAEISASGKVTAPLEENVTAPYVDADASLQEARSQALRFQESFAISSILDGISAVQKPVPISQALDLNLPAPDTLPDTPPDQTRA